MRSGIIPLFLIIFSVLPSRAQFLHPAGSTKTSVVAQPVRIAGFVDNAIDVTYYKLNLTVTVSPEYLSGVVTVRAIALTDTLRSVTLNLSSILVVDSISMHGAQVSFEHFTTNLLKITMDRVYHRGESIAIDVWYRGVPAGTGFGSFEFGSHNGTTWVWTLSEPYGASDWWPCKDHPLDKADSVDVWVTCDRAFKVGSNGRLISVIDNGNGTRTHHWAERYPIATYLVSIALTDYASFSNWFHYSSLDSMEVLNYVLPEHLDAALGSLPKIVPMLQIFSRLFGLYPFINEKYGHSEFGQGGAMEHQTMTSTITFDEDVIAHELAHQWFGDMITCANWQNLWLNEGFARYCESLYFEAMYGPAEYWATINVSLSNAISASGSLFVQDTSVVRQLFDNNRVYSKGAAVLHMLRHILGDTLFFRSLYAYAADPRLRFGNATTEDFQRNCESTSGQSLGYFFNEWVYGEKFPQYSFEWGVVPSGGGFRTTLTLSQFTDTFSPRFFTMPIDVRFTSGSWDTTAAVFHTFSGQQFSFSLSHKPETVLLDPDHWILRQITPPIPPLPASFRIEQNYPNPFNAGTSITYDIPRRSNVRIVVVNTLGEEIAVLVSGRSEPGTHTIRWNGTTDRGNAAPSGVYFCRFTTDGFSGTKRMVLIK